MSNKIEKHLKATPAKKTKGRSSITGMDAKSPTHPPIPQTQKTDAARPIGPGAGKHRGDRRDMSKTYTGNDKHSARGNTARRDVSTRAR